MTQWSLYSCYFDVVRNTWYKTMFDYIELRLFKCGMFHQETGGIRESQRRRPLPNWRKLNWKLTREFIKSCLLLFNFGSLSLLSSQFVSKWHFVGWPGLTSLGFGWWRMGALNVEWKGKGTMHIPRFVFLFVKCTPWFSIVLVLKCEYLDHGNFCFKLPHVHYNFLWV